MLFYNKNPTTTTIDMTIRFYSSTISKFIRAERILFFFTCMYVKIINYILISDIIIPKKVAVFNKKMNTEPMADFSIFEHSSNRLSRRSTLVKRSRVFKLSPDSAYCDVPEKNALLSLNLNEKCMSITKVTEKFLSTLTGKCYVVSVSGGTISGKSSLLNLILSILSDHVEGGQLDGSSDSIVLYTNIFQVGDGKRRTTDGLDFFCLRSGDQNVLFIDVEGDNDPVRKDMGTWLYSHLITTALAISHVHLYNYKGTVQQSFLQYFDSIGKLITQSKLHTNFFPKICFIKRDHSAEDETELRVDQDEVASVLKEEFNNESNLEYTVNLLPIPPNDLINKRLKTSCIHQRGEICKNCQEDLFLKSLVEFSLNLLKNLNTVPAYESGQELLDLIQKVLDVNKKNLPFVADAGFIAKIRAAKLNQEMLRINDGMLKAQGYTLDVDFCKQVKKLVTEQSGIIESELVDSYEKVVQQLLTKLSQTDYLLLELSRFLEESLIDSSFSVLNEEERTQVLKIYVYPFQNTMAETLEAFKEYQKLLTSVVEKLAPVKNDIETNVKEYVIGKSDCQALSVASSSSFFVSFVISNLAREVFFKVFAGCLVGSGAGIAIVSIICFIRLSKKFNQNKKESEKKVNLKTVPDIKKSFEQEDELKRIVQYFTNIIKDIGENNTLLAEILEEGKVPSESFLVEEIEKALEKKLKGESLTQDDINQLKIHFDSVNSKICKLKDNI